MNILILFSQPWRVGGAETHTEALIKGLAGHDVYLVVNHGSDEKKLGKIKELYPYTKITRIQTRGANLFKWRRDFQKLCALIKEKRIEIISAQQRTSGIWAHLLKRNLKIPYTVTMHDPWHRAFLKPLYANVFSEVFAVSENLANTLAQYLKIPRESIHLINNGIDFSSFYPLNKYACREKLGLSANDKIILHVSRLSRIKGAVSLRIIEGMEKVLEHCPTAKLVIIGEGPLRLEIEKKINELKSKFENRFEIHNFVDNILEWYNASDILVGEGRVAMETLACEKPIVAIRNAESFIGVITMKNIAYACDVNFDGRDRDACTQQVALEIEKAFAVTNEECKQIANYIKTRLSIETMVNKYLTVFESLTKK